MKMTIDKILRKLYSDNNIQYYTKIIRYTDEDNNTVRLLPQNKECSNTMYNSYEVVARALAKTCIDIILKTEDAKMARFAVNENHIDRWDIVNILKGPEGYMMFYYRNRTAEDNNIR